MDELMFNLCAGIHNLNLVSEAKRLINNFIDDGDGVVYVVNPDGSYLKLQKGVDFVGINGLGLLNKGGNYESGNEV